MRKLFALLSLVLFASTVAAAQTSSADHQVERELLQVNRELIDAYNRRDKAAVLSDLADGFFETEPNGAVFDRENVAARAENNPVGLKITQELSDVRLLLMGDTAVMSYRSDARFEGAGMKKESDGRALTLVSSSVTASALKGRRVFPTPFVVPRRPSSSR